MTSTFLPTSFPSSLNSHDKMVNCHTGVKDWLAKDDFRFTAEMAIDYGFLFALCGAVNQIYAGLGPSRYEAKLFLEQFGMLTPEDTSLFPVLGTLYKWVVNQQLEELRERPDYQEAQGFFRELASGKPPFEELPWGDFHKKKVQNKGGLLSDMLFALSLEQAAWLKSDQTAVLGSPAIEQAQKALAMAAWRRGDPEAFYQNAADVLISALEALKT